MPRSASEEYGFQADKNNAFRLLAPYLPIDRYSYLMRPQARLTRKAKNLFKTRLRSLCKIGLSSSSPTDFQQFKMQIGYWLLNQAKLPILGHRVSLPDVPVCTQSY